MGNGKSEMGNGKSEMGNGEREWEAKHKCLKNTQSLVGHREGVAKRNGELRIGNFHSVTIDMLLLDT